MSGEVVSLFVLQVEPLDHINNQVRRIFTTLFDEEHFNQFLCWQKEDDLAFVAEYRVSLDVCRLVGNLIAAHDCEPAHRLREIVASLIGLVFADLLFVIILELKED